MVQSLNKSTFLSTKALLYKNNLSIDVSNFINLLKKSPENKNFRDNIFPLRMSGIGQKYEHNSSCIKGNFFFKNIYMKNSYYRHNLIIFSKETDAIHNIIKTNLNDYLKFIDINFIDYENGEKVNGFDSSEIRNSFFFLRPDKMIEFKNNLENLHLLKNYLLEKN